MIWYIVEIKSKQGWGEESRHSNRADALDRGFVLLDRGLEVRIVEVEAQP